MNAAIRLPVEQAYASELQALARGDDRQKPPAGASRHKAVLTYLLGGKAGDGTAITPKYVGSRRLMETAVATLATDRALLLLGVPGTAKSWVSEHLAAAIMGDSTHARAVHGRHRREPDPLWLELCTNFWPRARARKRWCRRRSTAPCRTASSAGSKN